MWAKLSFRLKITVIFAVCLLSLTVILTALTLYNVRQSITLPMHESINNLSENFSSSSPQFESNDFSTSLSLDESDHLTDEQLREILDLFPNAHVSREVVNYTFLEQRLNALQSNFTLFTLLISGVIVIVGTIVIYFIASVAVKPIEELSTSISSIESNKLHEQLPQSKNQDEIARLKDSFNGMLRKLHQSFESKQLFAQNASHELKTPLAIINMDLEVIERSKNLTIEDYEETFAEIKKNTARMIGVVDGLLSMGKTDFEEVIIFNGRNLFVDILDDLSEYVESKSLSVQVHGETSFEGEKNLLPQAFFNLMSNAIRYNVNGGSITVTLSENQIKIEDTGIGIPPESIGHLFDPFYCVDKSRSKKLGGNGLGLAITKNILTAHDMEINISSEVEIGTSITVDW